MNEKDTRKIIKEEMNKDYKSGRPKVPPHQHNGVDNLKIDEKNIVLSTGAMGKVTMARNATYTFYFPAVGVSQMTFNGFATKTGGTIYALVYGTAILKSAFYFQPLSSSSIKVGGTEYPITGNGFHKEPAQSSTSLYIDQSGLASFNDTVNQFQFIDVFDSSLNSVATGVLNNLTAKSIDLQVTLATGWRIVGNFTII